MDILVCEEEGLILGTVSFIDNGRVAWLFRFAVLPGGSTEGVTTEPHVRTAGILRARGHSQVLVYSPVGDEPLSHRFTVGCLTLIRVVATPVFGKRYSLAIGASYTFTEVYTFGRMACL